MKKSLILSLFLTIFSLNSVSAESKNQYTLIKDNRGKPIYAIEGSYKDKNQYTLIKDNRGKPIYAIEGKYTEKQKREIFKLIQYFTGWNCIE